MNRINRIYGISQAQEEWLMDHLERGDGTTLYSEDGDGRQWVLFFLTDDDGTCYGGKYYDDTGLAELYIVNNEYLECDILDKYFSDVDHSPSREEIDEAKAVAIRYLAQPRVMGSELLASDTVRHLVSVLGDKGYKTSTIRDGAMD